ncbi:hypothetical protein [Cohnella sp. AR92]|uniref:hypothetical protein n=1 Tax=Cohnella sp. AR92 TaxID=648716 RepID=UPI0013150B8C|nr:hypothetical protein [Cohnella sp. AR92]
MSTRIRGGGGSAVTAELSEDGRVRSEMTYVTYGEHLRKLQGYCYRMLVAVATLYR